MDDTGVDSLGAADLGGGGGGRAGGGAAAAAAGAKYINETL